MIEWKTDYIQIYILHIWAESFIILNRWSDIHTNKQRLLPHIYRDGGWYDGCDGCDGSTDEVPGELPAHLLQPAHAGVLHHNQAL